MPANVETMFSVRETPWHGLGTIVKEAPTSAEALQIAGLDWTVESHDLIDSATGKTVDGYKANTRNTDGSVLGVVSDRYHIVQNTEAFEFMDNLIGKDVNYETAGSLRQGKQIWLLANMPKTSILGDDVEPYMCLTNSHDGLSSVRVCMTPVRVVCNNTLNLALSTATRNWSTKHMGDMNGKILAAQEALELGHFYMENLAKEAEVLANTAVSKEQLDKWLNEVFDYNDDISDRKKANIERAKESYMITYLAPDIAKFAGTGWGAVNAMADLVDHQAPARQTDSFNENRWGQIIIGHPVLDKMYKLITASQAA